MNNEISYERSIFDAVNNRNPGWSQDEIRLLHCPVCNCDNTHIEPPHLNYNAQWEGQGELAITPLWSECGSKWQVCLGFHKGQTAIFIRLIKSCKTQSRAITP